MDIPVVKSPALANPRVAGEVNPMDLTVPATEKSSPGLSEMTLGLERLSSSPGGIPIKFPFGKAMSAARRMVPMKGPVSQSLFQDWRQSGLLALGIRTTAEGPTFITGPRSIQEGALRICS